MEVDGGSLAIAVSWPGFTGGKYDIGVVLEGFENKLDLGSGRLTWFFGIGRGDLVQMHEQYGGDITVMGGEAGVSLGFNDKSFWPQQVNFHQGGGLGLSLVSKRTFVGSVQTVLEKFGR